MAANTQHPASILTFDTKPRKRTKKELLETAKEYGITGCEKLKVSELRQLLQAEADKRWNAWFSEWEKNRTTAPKPETSAPATEQQPETINVNYFQRFDSGDYDVINYAILDDTSRYHYTDNNSLPLQYLEAKCFYAYNCTNTENMRVVIDFSGTDEVLADMCRLVNAPISSNPTREECINAFISAAMEHKAMKAARETQASASTPATFTINPEVKPDYDVAFDEYAYSPDVQKVSVIVDDIPADHEPDIQEYSSSTRDTSSLQRLVAMTRKEVQQGYIPFSSRALWHNEIQKYHPEIKCWDNASIARKAACGDFSALPEDMLLIVQELSESETTAHVEPKTAVVDIQPKSQTTQPSEPKPSAPVQGAKPKRKLPTPKNPRGFVCNFSECKDPEKLRETLNGGSLNVVKSIAESFNEFQPRKDGKPMTKSDYVTAIVMLYFPDYQPKKPAQEVKRDCMGREIIQCGSKFIPGKFYVAGSTNYRNEPNPTPEFIKVIKRKNDTITVQVVSYPDFQPIFKPVSKKVKQFHYYHKGKTLALYESITLPNSHDYEGKDMRIASLCEYNAMFITTPGYDIDFDETAYSPNVQDVSVIVDDIPADHEPDMQEVKPEAPAPSEPERQQGKLCPLLSLSYWDRHTKYHNEKCRKNRKIIDTLQTIEEITAIMLDFGMNNIFEQAIYDRVHLSGQYPRETDEETTARYAETYAQKIIVRRQRKAKAEARKNAPKPATRKLHHAVKTDCNRQIVIQFDELENTPAPTSEPAKPKAKRKPRMPRVKRDYSRQVLIDFGKDIPDSQTNQRQAA